MATRTGEMNGLEMPSYIALHDSNIMSTEAIPTNLSNSTFVTTELPRTMTSSYSEYHAAMFIVKWVFPAIIFIGTVGNFMALGVLLTKRMRYTSVNIYLAYLAVVDTVVLYLSGFKTWIRALTDWELLQLSNAGCKIVMFLILLSLHVSAWLVVAVSLDRFVAIWFPFTSMALCTPTRARVLCAAITVVLAIYNSYAFWLIGLRAGRNGRMQCRGGPDSYFMHLVQPWMKLSTYSCVPFIIVLVLNICIIAKVVPGFNAKGHRLAGNAESSRSTNRNVKDSRLTAMLIWVSVSWLVLTAPMMLWTFAAKPATDSHSAAKNYLAKTVSFMLMYMNHGLNFYLYCLSGKRFRKALRELLTCNQEQKYALRQSETSMKTFRTTFRQ